MTRFRIRAAGRVIGAIGAATAMLTLGTNVPAVHADPLSNTSFAGVGSDTIQDLGDALAGAAGNPVKGYQPITALAADGATAITSWDAINPNGAAPHDCIIPKPGKPAIARPNGSGEGVTALSRAIDGGNWNPGNCVSTGNGNAKGSIDFARSSAGPKNNGTALSFRAFARDGVSYAYFDHGTNEVSALTTTQLHSLYGTGNASTGGTILVNGHTVRACMVQDGSGTGKFWNTAMGNTTAGIVGASALASGCGNSVGATVFEENGYNSWLQLMITKYGATTDDVVIPFSAGQWVAQGNQGSVDRSCFGRPAATRGANCPANPAGWATPTRDQLGSIDSSAPFTVAGTTYTPSAAYYAGATYGRDLFFVVDRNRVTVGNASEDFALEDLFTNLGGGASICTPAANATKATFGFLATTVSAACGEEGGTQALG